MEPVCGADQSGRRRAEEARTLQGALAGRDFEL